MLNNGSICTGIGGLDRAVEQIFDAETVWHTETDSGAKRILQHHHPDTPNHGDITQIDWGGCGP